MANKFKVGDIVVGNDKSPKNYKVTYKGNGEGTVIKITGENIIRVLWIGSDVVDHIFDVNTSYFDLKKGRKNRLINKGNKLVFE